MNLTIIIIGLGLLAAFIVPDVLITQAIRLKKKKYFNELNSLALAKSGSIAEFDQWKNLALGFDKENHKVYHIVKLADKFKKAEIDLKEVVKCKVIGDSSNHNATDKVELCISYNIANKPDLLIEFHDFSKDFNAVEDDLKLAEKWMKIIITEMAGFPKTSS